MKYFTSKSQLANKFFLTTRNSNSIYKIINSATKLHAEKLVNCKLKEKNFELKNFPSLKFIFFVLIELLSGNFFLNKKFINLKFNGYVLGRYVMSMAMRNGHFQTNKFLFNFSKLKYLIISGKIIKTLSQINNNVKALYVDHGMYINGIYIQAAIKKKLLLYTNNFPKGLFCSDFRKRNNKKTTQYQDLIILSGPDINNYKKLLVKAFLKKYVSRKFIIPWMKNSKFKKFRKNKLLYKNITHVIYAHSFLETQYIYGFDGFISYEDWLYFTINELSQNKQNKILVKPHPNFFTKNFSNINYIDLLIFNKIKKKFLERKNVFFINNSINNLELLNILPKKTIIITRHSTVIIESVFYNFKVISSKNTFWRYKNIKFYNQWSNIKEYKKVLSSSWNKLKFQNINKFYKLTYYLFLHPKNFFGKDFWLKIILSNYKKKRFNSNSFTNHEKNKKIIKNVFKKSIDYYKFQ